jgi:hypothetical protein
LISHGLIPRGYQQARAEDSAEQSLLRLQAAEMNLAVEIAHLEKLLEDPRWSASVNIHAKLERARERFAQVKAELVEARGPVRPVCAGRAAEERNEPPEEVVIDDSMMVKHSGYYEWKKMIERRRDESAGKEQGE